LIFGVAIFLRVAAEYKLSESLCDYNSSLKIPIVKSI